MHSQVVQQQQNAYGNVSQTIPRGRRRQLSVTIWVHY
jgi:hypothetical protein